jgi:hypothetical protein
MHTSSPSFSNQKYALILLRNRPHFRSQSEANMCTNQYPRTQQRFGDQPSRSLHTVDACSWPFRCGQSGRYRVGWEKGRPIQFQSAHCPPRSNSFRIYDQQKLSSSSYLGERVGHTAGRAIGGQDGDSRTGSHLEGLMTLS